MFWSGMMMLFRHCVALRWIKNHLKSSCVRFLKSLMIDPVVAASGQTFDEEYIQKWLEKGKTKCPKTNQLLPFTVLIPNHLIKDMIAKWCKASHLDPPASRPPQALSLDAVPLLLVQLAEFPSLDDHQRRATLKQIHLHSACPSFRALVKDMSPLLTPSMIRKYYYGEEMYNDVLATILNTSIDGTNKGKIVKHFLSATGFLVEALGSDKSAETRGLAAAAICGLSADDRYKSLLGIPTVFKSLIKLVRLKHPLASREAACAVFSLCKLDENMERVLHEKGLIVVIDMLDCTELIDVMLEILALFSTNQTAVEVTERRSVVP